MIQSRFKSACAGTDELTIYVGICQCSQRLLGYDSGLPACICSNLKKSCCQRVKAGRNRRSFA